MPRGANGASFQRLGEVVSGLCLGLSLSAVLIGLAYLSARALTGSPVFRYVGF